MVSARVVATTTSSGAVPVPDRDQFAVGVGVVHLDVGQRGQAARAPVDDPLGPVDEAVVVEPLEDRLHGAGQALVHGEALAGPVHAVAEPAHLAEDLPAGGGLPLPHPLHERLAAQVMPGQAVLGQFPLDHVLGGDARVVHAGQPQRGVALHPPPPDQRIHERVIERMAHVQGAGHVRRRDHDASTPAAARPRPRRTGPWRPTRRSAAPPPRPARIAAEAGFAGLRSRQVSLGPSRAGNGYGHKGVTAPPPRWIGTGSPCEPEKTEGGDPALPYAVFGNGGHAATGIGPGPVTKERGLRSPGVPGVAPPGQHCGGDTGVRRGPAAVRSLVPHRLALTAVMLTAVLAATLLVRACLVRGHRDQLCRAGHPGQQPRHQHPGHLVGGFRGRRRPGLHAGGRRAAPRAARRPA